MQENIEEGLGRMRENLYVPLPEKQQCEREWNSEIIRQGQLGIDSA